MNECFITHWKAAGWPMGSRFRSLSTDMEIGHCIGHKILKWVPVDQFGQYSFPTFITRHNFKRWLLLHLSTLSLAVSLSWCLSWRKLLSCASAGTRSHTLCAGRAFLAPAEHIINHREAYLSSVSKPASLRTHSAASLISVLSRSGLSVFSPCAKFGRLLLVLWYWRAVRCLQS